MGEPAFDVARKEVGTAPVPITPYVESGIHFLADLIAKQRSAEFGIEMSPLTGSTSGKQSAFKNTSFWMAPSHTGDGLTVCGIPNFEWYHPSGPTANIMVWWHEHGQRGAFMSRPVKGREWMQAMVDCLKSLGA